MSMVYDFKWKPSMKAHIERHGHIKDQELNSYIHQENIILFSTKQR